MSVCSLCTRHSIWGYLGTLARRNKGGLAADLNKQSSWCCECCRPMGNADFSACGRTLLLKKEPRKESLVPGAIVLFPCKCKHLPRSLGAQLGHGKMLAGVSCTQMKTCENCKCDVLQIQFIMQKKKGKEISREGLKGTWKCCQKWWFYWLDLLKVYFWVIVKS